MLFGLRYSLYSISFMLELYEEIMSLPVPTYYLLDDLSLDDEYEL